MATNAYFDTHHEAMAANREAGTDALCYTQQVALLESLLTPGATVLDVGCGPHLPYAAPRSHVIGLDPSGASLAQNTDVDDRIMGSATRIPLDDESVDLAVAFYSLHHLTAETVHETDARRHQALREIARVLRPGGELLVFEMRPWRLAALAQRWLWPPAKRLLGARLDTYFWSAGDFGWFGYRAGLGSFDGPTVTVFDCSAVAFFPPVLSLPWLKLPRCLYPLDAVLYRWTKE